MNTEADVFFFKLAMGICLFMAVVFLLALAIAFVCVFVYRNKKVHGKNVIIFHCMTACISIDTIHSIKMSIIPM